MPGGRGGALSGWDGGRRYRSVIHLGVWGLGCRIGRSVNGWGGDGRKAGEWGTYSCFCHFGIEVGLGQGVVGGEHGFWGWKVGY